MNGKVAASPATETRSAQNAFDPDRFPSDVQIPSILCNSGLLDEQAAADLGARAEEEGATVQSVLARLDLIPEEQWMQAIAAWIGLPFVRIDPLRLNNQVVIGVLPFRFAQKHQMLVVDRRDDLLTIALGRPYHGVPLADIANMTGLRIEPVVATPTDVSRCITYFYGIHRSLTQAEAELVAPTVDPGNLEQLYELRGLAEISLDSKPLVNTVNYLLHSAFDQRASDIHVEPKRRETWIRFRIDGILHTVMRIEDAPERGVDAEGRQRAGKKLHGAIISRIKMMAGLDIAEKRRPQDGRIKISHGVREIELRLSVMPVAFGEKVVLRIFDPDVLLKDLGELGFAGGELTTYNEFISNSNGIILVTGPTGSGKTTTLYSSLRHLSTGETNITTIEDPIELVHEEFNQIAVRERVGITFATAIRTILRQDPDIIMVGEIRDRDTAENAVQAALTGHLVFSTLHTNDAPSSITRLIDMGVPPFLISSTVIGVIAQRLVRTVCRACATSYPPSAAEIERMGLQVPAEQRELLRFRRGEGCPSCRYTGYYGRGGIFEIMPMSPRLRQLTRDCADAKEIRLHACAEGMTTLRESALRKVAQGLTTVEEIRRVTSEV
ncbi:MAG: type II/IV secretion system protein [Candidatus Schekmanbacteria bacterium]|nr:type II/IV secretion system protein [Candidatus Schekmanbacteria bacterium]